MQRMQRIPQPKGGQEDNSLHEKSPGHATNCNAFLNDRDPSSVAEVFVRNRLHCIARRAHTRTKPTPLDPLPEKSQEFGSFQNPCRLMSSHVISQERPR